MKHSRHPIIFPIIALFALLEVRAIVSPNVSLQVFNNGSFSLVVDDTLWLTNGIVGTVCVGGISTPLLLLSSSIVSGHDAFGSWRGPQLIWSIPSSTKTVVQTFKTYDASNSFVVLDASFPQGLNTTGCGTNTAQSTNFPSFSTVNGLASSLGFLSWRSTVLSDTISVQGLQALNQGGLDCGPVIAFDGDERAPRSLMWSTLTSHKIVVQTTNRVIASAIASLWSASRNDQIACLSNTCFDDQKTDGTYVTQRVEGFAFTNVDENGLVMIDGKAYSTIALVFAWSSIHVDNWVGTNSTTPDGSYIHYTDGYVLKDNSAPGSIPLQVYYKKYNDGHFDYATVASREGIAWAHSNGYTYQYSAGFVLSSSPSSSSSYSMGVSAAIPEIPAQWSYSVLISASYGGPTKAAYEWGSRIQSFYGTYRLPSITLSNVGYYTDDGAYYYVWEAYNIPARPWPAQEGLLLVKDQLVKQGVPIAYMQLDDWWYNGPFYFGNVKSVVDWHASNSSRLFPDGLLAFCNKLNISIQLYTPFWNDLFQTKYNMTESTVFKGTKLVTPDDSYAFFCDYFDFGSEQTGGRFSIFEIDFLDSNFAGSSSMFESVFAADKWYAGMADAAFERGISLQYCLPSATDMLESLSFPAVVQARASADYVGTVNNPYQLGGSSLLMGAVAIAPSKDTLWTASPQPPTYSDKEHHNDYTEQPHVQLDAVLATLSLGPVGISDALGYTDTFLISQSFRCSTDGTLLRPARPLSWVDSFFVNKSKGHEIQDIRGTHSSIPLVRGGSPSAPTLNTHYIVAWRTTQEVVLGPTDLYPVPNVSSLVSRRHILGPNRDSQFAGCVDGQRAFPSCVSQQCAECIEATGTDLANFSLTAVYEQLSNGAYFLGELDKFVHVSPQRFEYLVVDKSSGGLAGLVAGVRGCAGQNITLAAVDPAGVARVVSATIPASGFIDVAL